MDQKEVVIEMALQVQGINNELVKIVKRLDRGNNKFKVLEAGCPILRQEGVACSQGEDNCGEPDATLTRAQRFKLALVDHCGKIIVLGLVVIILGLTGKLEGWIP
jgi:hypothetical protein